VRESGRARLEEAGEGETQRMERKGDTAMQKLRIGLVGFRMGYMYRSRGRFATPADSPHQDCSAYRGLHVRRESLGFVHRSRAIL
jgi:hypothetical protein